MNFSPFTQSTVSQAFATGCGVGASGAIDSGVTVGAIGKVEPHVGVGAVLVGHLST